jgi:hypothetical protein
MNKYNNYAEKIIPIMLEHNLITQEEQDIMTEFVREITGEDYA